MRTRIQPLLRTHPSTRRYGRRSRSPIRVLQQREQGLAPVQQGLVREDEGRAVSSIQHSYSSSLAGSGPVLAAALCPAWVD